MLRGYRGILLALGVIAALATLIGILTWPIPPRLQPYGYEQPRAGDYHAGGKACEPSALSAIRDGRKAASEREACAKEAENYRLQTNDLIQQTRAADAAKAQAEVASQGLWTAWLQALGGFLTLCAAVGAAIYARDAAQAARAALAHDKERAEAELRAWVTIDVEIPRLKADSHEFAIDYDVVFTNIGQTAARHLKTFVTNRFHGDKPGELIAEIYDKWGCPPKRKTAFTLMPGEDTTYNGSCACARTLIPWFGHGEPKRAYFNVIATCVYWSDIDQSWHRTDRSFTVGEKVDDFFKDRFIFDNMGGTYSSDQIRVKRSRSGETT